MQGGEAYGVVRGGEVEGRARRVEQCLLADLLGDSELMFNNLMLLKACVNSIVFLPCLLSFLSCVQILEPLVDGKLALEEVSEVVGDTLRLLGSRDMRQGLLMRPGAAAGGVAGAGDEDWDAAEGGAVAAAAAGARRLVAALARKQLLEGVVPVLVEMRTMLMVRDTGHRRPAACLLWLHDWGAWRETFLRKQVRKMVIVHLEPIPMLTCACLLLPRRRPSTRCCQR